MLIGFFDLVLLGFDAPLVVPFDLIEARLKFCFFSSTLRLPEVSQ